MKKKIKKLAKKAGFVIWDDSSWGPGKGNIDWSCDYDKELTKFVELIVNECAEIADTAEPFLASDLIKQHFGVE
jgi:hypothetical protein